MVIRHCTRHDVALAWWALVLVCVSATAQPLQLIDDRLGLAWSRQEVASAGEPALDAALHKARASGGLGCRTHCALIQAVWRRLSPVFAAQQATRRHRFTLKLHVVQQDDVDAFATPDGSIVLSEAFVRHEALDAPQLAFVLSHEVAHVLLEHERQTLTTALALLPRNVPRTVSDIYVELAFNFGLLKAIEPSLHQAEFEADEVGFELAALAGYAPARQLRFMQAQARQGDEASSVSTSHPAARARLQRLRSLLPLASRIYAGRARASRWRGPASRQRRPG